MGYGVLFIAFIIGLYIISYSLNKNTPAPIDLKIDPIKCGACSNYGCALKQNTVEEE
ncbi:MAG: hypothetical protein ACNA7U_02145 [Candidatus Izemoplasmataceae bacterium]|jgi:hypothetical protein